MTVSSDVVLVSTTYFDLSRPYDVIRSELAIQAAQEAVKKGYPYIIVDGGSDKSVIDRLCSVGVVVINQEQTGLGSARRQCIQAGYDSDAKVVCYFDPEKVSFVQFVASCAAPILENTASFVVPSRNSMVSYPAFQEHSEKFINHYWNELTTTTLDVTFGPRLFNRELAYLFLEYDGRYGDKWDSIFIPLLHALKNNIALVDVPTDFIYPAEQKRVEEHDLFFYDKRLEQVRNLVVAFKEYWKG